MADQPIISYSRGKQTSASFRDGARTVIAAGCLLFLLWSFYFSFWQFYSDQYDMFQNADRCLAVVGWHGTNGTAVLLPPAFITPARNGPALYGTGREVPSLTALPFSALFGIYASAALFHWRRSRVRWLAAALPVAAGGWRGFEMIFHTMTRAPFLITGFNLGMGQGLTGMANASPGVYGLLIVVILLQAAVGFFAASIGRPIAVWLASILLPHSLSASLQSIWVD